MSTETPGAKPKPMDHSYALNSKGDDAEVGEQSSSDSNSSDSSSSGESETEAVLDIKKPEQNNRNVPVSMPIVTADETSNPKSLLRTRTPPNKYVDLFVSVTPKGSPSGKKTPKRLSTSVTRKAKEPLRKRRTKSEGGAAFTPGSTRPSRRTRGKACGECEPCNRKDCGKCAHCLDKIKFGGPGKRKQKCSMRVCVNMISKRAKLSADSKSPKPVR